MAKVLELVFLTGDKDTVKLTVDDPKPDATAQQVEAVMQQVIASGVFTFDGSPLASIKSARIVERDARTLISR